MKIAAVIAEYNPFHQGHLYQLRQIKAQGAGAVVVIMSGNFMQRGDAACMEKHLRAKAALSCGADLVVELPLPYALNTAERFAFGGVSIANALGCVDELCFGTEIAEVYPLERAAQLLQSSQLYSLIREYSQQGISFAKAREMAVAKMGFPDMAKVLQTPNNILAIEYIGWLIKTNSQIQPIAIQRKGSSHHDGSGLIHPASASAIRWLMLEDKPLEDCLPPPSLEIYRQACRDRTAPVFLSHQDRLLLGRLRGLSQQQLSALPDLTEGIENRLLQSIRGATSYTMLLESMKTKRYTLARIRRLCLSAALGVDGQLCRYAPPYIRVLGFTPVGTEVLHLAKQTCTLPISHSLAILEKQGELAARFAALESASTDLYHLMTPTVFPCGLDYTTPPVLAGG